MSRKKRIITLTLIVTILAGALSSCSMTLGKSKNNEVSISVAWATSNNMRAKAQEKINDFRKIYGDINVRPDTWILDTSTYYMKAATGRLPTVFSVVMTEAEKLKNSGFGIELTDYMKKYEYDNYIRKEIKDIVSKGGEY